MNVTVMFFAQKHPPAIVNRKTQAPQSLAAHRNALNGNVSI
jgi:hypothetical protein